MISRASYSKNLKAKRLRFGRWAAARDLIGHAPPEAFRHGPPGAQGSGLAPFLPPRASAMLRWRRNTGISSAADLRTFGLEPLETSSLDSMMSCWWSLASSSVYAASNVAPETP